MSYRTIRSDIKKEGRGLCRQTRVFLIYVQELLCYEFLDVV